MRHGGHDAAEDGEKQEDQEEQGEIFGPPLPVRLRPYGDLLLSPGLRGRGSVDTGPRDPSGPMEIPPAPESRGRFVVGNIIASAHEKSNISGARGGGRMAAPEAL